ncbi:protein-glutamate O-methyltransferase CheR [Alicyclobacillus sp. TC]|uniref:CheR family methyltransferase n=1 Tax=Alicyclobacillus sp. TC TaxID=2606450 RepID=UPI001931976B|nr:protein-glutamate O-methyltransferase CheR [Alicyclobacillus sp. TC]
MEDDFEQFIREFYHLTGLDLAMYKRQQMQRRLAAWGERLGYSTFQELSHAIHENPSLIHTLLDKMTINVSEFFRNRDRWNSLASHLSTLSSGSRLQIWSAACSTGEEPYTINILCKEHLKIDTRILATDIDEDVLQKANEAKYQAYQVREFNQQELNRYFDYGENVFTLKKEYKEGIVFKKHNLLSDTYPSNIDLIVCRNVLIYFTEEAKDLILHRFSQTLKSGGLLFLGSTEQLMQPFTYQLKSIAPFLYQKM